MDYAIDQHLTLPVDEDVYFLVTFVMCVDSDFTPHRNHHQVDKGTTARLSQDPTSKDRLSALMSDQWS
jgi:hypothetical protein